MTLYCCALLILGLSSVLAAIAGGRNRLAAVIGIIGALVGGLLGLVPAVCVSLGSASLSFRAPWAVPYGEFFIAIDPLTALFLLPVFGLSALGAIYSSEYLAPFQGHKPLGPAYGWFNLLTVAMALVVAARNAMVFLVAWEVMSLASFFLVTFEDELREVRKAGWVYLIATHLGTAFLFVLFALLGRQAGSMNFDQFQMLGPLSPVVATSLFICMLIGFGTKAGFVPLHVWLPEAHPAAPSHVSAVMSGVMIKLGIYGILRVLTFLGPPPLWWGMTILIIGLTSGILGVLYALAQHDLKRLLAYHSVENIGIIALGIGVGLLGQSAGAPWVSALGFGGALLHVLNHSLFKGLLFLGAGSVLHATGTRELDRLGGLLRQMPWTAAAFLVGSVAICGLPLLNGFVSEWLIYSGSLRGIMSFPSGSSVLLVMAVAGLAMIGGLAAACFTKVFGVVFLGAPRHSLDHSAHEAGLAMTIPMGVLGLTCFAIGLWPVGACRLVYAAVGIMITATPAIVQDAFAIMRGTLLRTSQIGAILLGITFILTVLRRRLLYRRPVAQTVTWDCGYSAPTVRMQYTASSFARPLVRLFRVALRTRFHGERPVGYFPVAAQLTSHTSDVAQEQGFSRIFRGIRRGLEYLRWLQQGRVQLYLLYIFLTLIVLMVWKLGI